MFAEKGKHFIPGIHGLLGTVAFGMVIPEAVAGAVITVKLVIFIKFLQFGFMPVNLGGSRELVIIAKQTQQRTLEFGR